MAKLLYYESLDNGTNDYWFRVMLIVHILSWTLQFVGHGVFEKRAPALTSNLALSLNAPFFVTAEILQMLGWRKEEF